MKAGAVFLLVLGLANLLTAAELALDDIPPSDLKEIEAEIAKGNTPPGYAPSDKAKRGVSKLSGDSPSYSNLPSSGGSSAKSPANANQAPYRYLYNNQNYQSASYLQTPQGSHLGAQQYPFQASGVSHYLQTPTQIQFVAASPQGLKYQKDQTSQFQIAPAQQLYLQSPQALYQAHATAASAQTPSPGASSQYQVPQHLYYQQQPIVMLLVQQPQLGAVLYPNQQQQQTAYILGQQPFLNVFGGHRFSLPYSAAQNSQVTYLIPMAVQATPHHAAAPSSGAKPADKAALNVQAAAHSPSTYGLRATKA